MFEEFDLENSDNDVKNTDLFKEMEMEYYTILDNNFLITEDTIYCVTPYENNTKLYGAIVVSPTAIRSIDDDNCYFSTNYTFELRELMFGASVEEKKIQKLIRLLAISVELPKDLSLGNTYQDGVNNYKCASVDKLEELTDAIISIGLYQGIIDTYDVIKFIYNISIGNRINPFSIDKIISTNIIKDFIRFVSFSPGKKGSLDYFICVNDACYAHNSVDDGVLKGINSKLKGFRVRKTNLINAIKPGLEFYYNLVEMFEPKNNIQLLSLFSVFNMSDISNVNNTFYQFGTESLFFAATNKQSLTNKMAIKMCLHALLFSLLGNDLLVRNKSVLAKNFANFIFRICLKDKYSVDGNKLMVALKNI